MSGDGSAGTCYGARRSRVERVDSELRVSRGSNDGSPKSRLQSEFRLNAASSERSPRRKGPQPDAIIVTKSKTGLTEADLASPKKNADRWGMTTSRSVPHGDNKSESAVRQRATERSKLPRKSVSASDHHGHHSFGHHHHSHHHAHHEPAKGDACSVEALSHQEALLLDQIEFWKERKTIEAELRRECEAELEAHRKHAAEERANLYARQKIAEELSAAEWQAKGDFDAQILAWQREQTSAEAITKLMNAELRVAHQKVQDVRNKIKAKHRLRTAAGIREHNSNSTELRFLNEGEAEAFRDRIAVEFHMQLMELPVSEVRPCILQIVGEAEFSDQYTADDIKRITRCQRLAKRWLYRSASKRPSKREYHEDSERERHHGRHHSEHHHGERKRHAEHDRSKRHHTRTKAPVERQPSTEMDSPTRIDRSYADAINQLASAGYDL